jgi:hypothetical protein
VFTQPAAHISAADCNCRKACRCAGVLPRTHRGCLPNAEGANGAPDVLHAVIDGEPCGDHPAWGVDVHLDLQQYMGVYRAWDLIRCQQFSRVLWFSNGSSCILESCLPICTVARPYDTSFTRQHSPGPNPYRFIRMLRFKVEQLSHYQVAAMVVNGAIDYDNALLCAGKGKARQHLTQPAHVAWQWWCRCR